MDIVDLVRQTGRDLLAGLKGSDAWAGSEESYEWVRAIAFRMVLNAPHEVEALQLRAESGDNGAPPSLLQVQGTVGMIGVSGPLVSRGNWITQLFGIASYPDIRNAFAEASNNAQVKDILFYLDSPGGAVSGVNETAAMVAKINSDVKPVTSFTDGTMASAAYWLGVSGKTVIASEDAQVGSIGVITVHMDRTKQLADEGIKATVLRAGKYKNLANPFEPLSDMARDEIQASLDAHYDIFVGHVAKSLKETVSTVDTKMAQGRVFTGTKALAVGLVHKNDTLANTLASLYKKHDVDISKRMYKNPTHASKGAISMTPEQLAAAAAAAQAQAAVEEAKRLADLNTPEALAAAEAARVAKSAADAAEAEKVAKAALDKAAATPTDVTAYLQGQIKELNAQVLTLSMESRDLKVKQDAMEVTHAPMLKIVSDSLNKMRVALGGSATDLSTLAPTALLEQHAACVVDFEKKFKVGGVAATAPEVKKTEEAAAAVSVSDSAKITAVRFGKK